MLAEVFGLDADVLPDPRTGLPIVVPVSSAASRCRRRALRDDADPSLLERRVSGLRDGSVGDGRDLVSRVAVDRGGELRHVALEHVGERSGVDEAVGHVVGAVGLGDVDPAALLEGAVPS